MKQVLFWLLFISLSLLLHTTNSVVEEGVKTSLISFLAKLNGTIDQPDPSFGWNGTTDPCVDKWKGVTCDSQTSTFVRRIQLNQSGLSGTFDAAALCNFQPLSNSLQMIKLDLNNVGGQLPPEIANCKNLRRLHLGQNRFVGNLPDSLTNLTNLQRLDISYNNFSGNVPNISQLAGLDMFLVQYNQLSGRIPNFDLTRFGYFNVSFNDFTGPIPDKLGNFNESSFLGNPGLCGEILKRNCVSSPNPNNISSEKKSKLRTKDQMLLYTGYGAVGFVLISVFLYTLWKRKNRGGLEDDSAKKVTSFDNGTSKPSSASTEYNASKSEFSANAAQSPMVSTSLVVLTSPEVCGLKFDDLLRAPAELIGRGTHGSLYKVICENGMILAVKRIKDWGISCSEFKQRMQTIFKVNHPNVLPVLAFYCSSQEKLLVYEYQQYGSLHTFIHGTQAGQALFDWTSRLNVAASIAEALAAMHQELLQDGIAHGNLKASNILLNKSMQPCISEYGLMEGNEEDEEEEEEEDDEDPKNPFKKDVHGFGVIVLQLLTGKLVQKNGLKLTTWVDSVVREEWTVEVFDKKLITEGASEERMLNLLQVAIKCVNKKAKVRPTMSQVALLINTIKEEEDKSLTFESSECESRY
ncbi:probable inactive receptor kinase At2g26730 [Euphorbia lathyris]|uniref:probable inactive receptor kinase At2g26730 n=1 Tax=Euphorbia lathyris TaxID=212925 RepID=UPI003313D74E